MSNLSGEDLLVFLEEVMDPRTYYQPLIIAELISSDGVMTRRALAERLLIHDETSVVQAERVLMRWPRQTLAKHGVVSYESTSKEFTLDVDFTTEEQKEQAKRLCWSIVGAMARPKQAGGVSRRYAALLRAQGRCVLCGTSGLESALDIDHIIPKSRRDLRTNKVLLPSGTLVDVDDPENLQILCESCNRGKQALDDTDFRPSLDRLASAIAGIEKLAQEYGHSTNELLALVEEKRAALLAGG